MHRSYGKHPLGNFENTAKIGWLGVLDYRSLLDDTEKFLNKPFHLVGHLFEYFDVFLIASPLVLI